MKIDYNYNGSRRLLAQKGNMTIFEYDNDSVKTRQLYVAVNTRGVWVDYNSIQMVAGNIEFVYSKKALENYEKKPRMYAKPTPACYKGSGAITLKPTSKHIILFDLKEWESFCAGDANTLARSSKVELSSEVDINPNKHINSFRVYSGNGLVALESDYAPADLALISLEDEELIVDEKNVIAWSSSLSREVNGKETFNEGEYLYNFKGTGKVLVNIQ